MYKFMLQTFLFMFLISAVQVYAQKVKAYAGNDNRLEVIDVETMTVIDTIDGGEAYRMVLTPDGKKLYTTNHNRMVLVIDAEADTLLKAFDPSSDTLFTSELEGIAISPDGGRVYVADESSDLVFTIDTRADTTLFEAELDLYEAEDMIVSPDGEYLYVNDNDYVSKIRTDSLIIVATTYTSNDGHGITLSADGSKIYAEGRNSTTRGVAVINTDSMTIDTVLSASGYHLETSRDGQYVFGVNESRTFSVIETGVDTVVASIDFTNIGSIRGISETPDGHYILLAGSRGVIKIDAVSFEQTDTIAVGSYRTVVSKNVTISSIENSGYSLPGQLNLLSNYPNPFNPVTTIPFETGSAGNVTLKIYNSRGQLVRTLLDKTLNAGLHKVKFKAGSLASGIYFYRLKYGRQVKTKKMLLLR